MPSKVLRTQLISSAPNLLVCHYCWLYRGGGGRERVDRHEWLNGRRTKIRPASHMVFELDSIHYLGCLKRRRRSPPRRTGSNNKEIIVDILTICRPELMPIWRSISFRPVILSDHLPRPPPIYYNNTTTTPDPFLRLFLHRRYLSTS